MRIGLVRGLRWRGKMFIAKTVEGLEEVAAKEVGGKRLMRRRVVGEKL